MKATIRDPAVLRSLRPLEVAAYLHAAGWKKTAEHPSKWSRWVRPAGLGEEIEAMLPLDPTFGDFCSRISDVLRVLEVAEARSQMEIAADILEASADVIRIRLAGAEMNDGTMPLDDGASFFSKAKDLMLAAACAAAGPRPYYPSKKPNQALDYMRRVRLGQTARGSFVMTILSRVAPCLASGNGALFEPDEPFERRVTQTLAQSLVAVRSAAEDAASTGKIDSFVAAVPKGVSANFCDAIAGIAGSGEGDRAIEVALTWSRHRPPQPHQVPSAPILLPADAAPVIRQAARYFKETTPREDFMVQGLVVKLERGDGDPTGRVTVLSLVDEQTRRIVFDLGDPAYHDAVTAHDKKQTVVCYGILVRDGKLFRLREPQDFRLVEDE